MSCITSVDGIKMIGQLSCNVYCYWLSVSSMASKTCTCSCYTSIISTFPTPILTYPSLSHLYGWPCLYVLIAAAMSSEAVPIEIYINL